MNLKLHSQSSEDMFDLRASLITLFEAVPDNVIFKDGHGRWLVANAPARKLFKLDKLAWQGKPDAELGELNPILKPLHGVIVLIKVMEPHNTPTARNLLKLAGRFGYDGIFHQVDN